MNWNHSMDNSQHRTAVLCPTPICGSNCKHISLTTQAQKEKDTEISCITELRKVRTALSSSSHFTALRWRLGLNPGPEITGLDSHSCGYVPLQRTEPCHSKAKHGLVVPKENPQQVRAKKGGAGKEGSPGRRSLLTWGTAKWELLDRKWDEGENIQSQLCLPNRVPVCPPFQDPEVTYWPSDTKWTVHKHVWMSEGLLENVQWSSRWGACCVGGKTGNK